MSKDNFVIIKPNVTRNTRGISKVLDRSHFAADYSAVTKRMGLKTSTWHPDDTLAVFTVTGDPIDINDVEKYLSAYPIRTLSYDKQDEERFIRSHPRDKSKYNMLPGNFMVYYAESKGSINLAREWIFVELSVDGLPPYAFSDQDVENFRMITRGANPQIMKTVEREFSLNCVRYDLARRKKQHLARVEEQMKKDYQMAQSMYGSQNSAPQFIHGGNSEYTEVESPAERHARETREWENRMESIYRANNEENQNQSFWNWKRK